MRRHINAYACAQALFYSIGAIEYDHVDDICDICNLCQFEKLELIRLYRRCTERNISAYWTIQALTWFLNNL